LVVLVHWASSLKIKGNTLIIHFSIRQKIFHSVKEVNAITAMTAEGHQECDGKISKLADDRIVAQMDATQRQQTGCRPAAHQNLSLNESNRFFR
jgi:hypothetical protein